MKVVTFSIALVVLTVPSTYGSVPTSEFFTYGIANGDAQLPIARGNFVNVPLSRDRVFNLLDSSYSSLFVNNNGVISFSEGKHYLALSSFDTLFKEITSISSDRFDILKAFQNLLQLVELQMSP